MIHVSDHACLRYIERVLGIDVDAIRTELANPIIQQAVEFGADTVILGSGARLKLKGDTVATVLPKRTVKPKRGRRSQ